MSDFKTFIGVELVKALSMTRGEAVKHGYYKANINTLKKDEIEAKGYLVDYGNYKEWFPKARFDEMYFRIEGNTKISKSDVESFLVKGEATKLGAKTTVVLDSTLTGFDMTATSACVDPAQHDLEIGAEIARKDIINDLWGHLGFVLQWAKNGLKAKSNS